MAEGLIRFIIHIRWQARNPFCLSSKWICLHQKKEETIATKTYAIADNILTTSRSFHIGRAIDRNRERMNEWSIMKKNQIFWAFSFPISASSDLLHLRRSLRSSICSQWSVLSISISMEYNRRQRNFQVPLLRLFGQSFGSFHSIYSRFVRKFRCHRTRLSVEDNLLSSSAERRLFFSLSEEKI